MRGPSVLMAIVARPATIMWASLRQAVTFYTSSSIINKVLLQSLFCWLCCVVCLGRGLLPRPSSRYSNVGAGNGLHHRNWLLVDRTADQGYQQGRAIYYITNIF